MRAACFPLAPLTILRYLYILRVGVDCPLSFRTKEPTPTPNLRSMWVSCAVLFYVCGEPNYKKMLLFGVPLVLVAYGMHEQGFGRKAVAL